jgi:hypothetical protein
MANLKNLIEEYRENLLDEIRQREAEELQKQYAEAKQKLETLITEKLPRVQLSDYTSYQGEEDNSFFTGVLFHDCASSLPKAMYKEGIMWVERIFKELGISYITVRNGNDLEVIYQQ